MADHVGQVGSDPAPDPTVRVAQLVQIADLCDNTPMPDRSLRPRPRFAPGKRKLAKVPYVELFHGETARLQGVVSSGSDPARVYVSFIDAQTGDSSCSTNNNRPCGGGSRCGHVTTLVETAIALYGAERVARFLGCPDVNVDSAHAILGQLHGTQAKRDHGEVFARFLDYLRYVGLPPSTEPLPEMAWFHAG